VERRLAQYIENHLPKETGWKAYIKKRTLSADSEDQRRKMRVPEPDGDVTLIVVSLDPEKRKDTYRKYTDFNKALNFICDKIFLGKPCYDDREYDAKVGAFEKIKEDIMCGQYKILLKDLFKDIDLYGSSDDYELEIYDEVIVLQGNMRRSSILECENNIFANYADLEADIYINVVRVYRGNTPINLFCFSISKKADPNGASWMNPLS